MFIKNLNVSDRFETNDLDLDLQGQIGLETCKIFVLNFKLTHLEFAFSLKLFIDHLYISDRFENWWPWPFNVKLALKLKKNCVIPCECNNFWTVGILPSNLSCVLII